MDTIPTARTPGADLNSLARIRAGDRGHQCPVPDVREPARGPRRPLRSRGFIHRLPWQYPCVKNRSTAGRAPVRAAAAHLIARRKLVVEYSGAAAAAALLAGRVPAAGRKVCAVLSGGNLDTSLLGGMLGSAATPVR